MGHPLLDNISFVNTFDEHTMELISGPYGLIVVTGPDVDKNLTTMSLIRGYLGDATKYGTVFEVGDILYPDVNNGFMLTSNDKSKDVKEVTEQFFHEDHHALIMESINDHMLSLALEASLVGNLVIVSFESKDNHSAMDYLVKTLSFR